MSILKEDEWDIIQCFYENEKVPAYLLCIICNKLLIDATNGPCGCRYCRKCIFKYLDNNSLCPGNLQDCKGRRIGGYDIISDRKANQEVLKICVFCPYSGCREETDLRAMINHTVTCRKAPITCVYMALGCRKMRSNMEINEHLELEKQFHEKLLLTSVIGNGALLTETKDRLENVTNVVAQLKLENADLKERFELQKELAPKTGSFVWKIANFSELVKLGKTKTVEEYSEYFFTHPNGYRLCMKVSLEGYTSYRLQFVAATHVSVSLFFVRGSDNELRLAWPMRPLISASLLNYKTGVSHCQADMRARKPHFSAMLASVAVSPSAKGDMENGPNLKQALLAAGPNLLPLHRIDKFFPIDNISKFTGILEDGAISLRVEVINSQ